MTIRWQLVLLVLQLVLITAWLGGQFVTETNTSDDTLLSDIQIADLQQLQISDEHDNKVLIIRQTGQWVLPDYYHLSVNKDQLQSLLSKIIQVNPGWAIARTGSAAQRFYVSEKQFKRHIQLTMNNNQTADIYIGESAGLRKAYIREGGSNNIYSLDISTYMAPATEVEWFDKSVIKAPQPLVSIKAADFTLQKTPEGWKLADNTDEVALDQGQVNLMASYLSYPQVSGVAAADLVASIINKKPDAQFELGTGQQTIEVEFYKTDAGTIVRSSLSELHFIVEEYVAKNLLEMNKSMLMVKEKDEQQTDQTQQQEE